MVKELHKGKPNLLPEEELKKLRIKNLY